MATTPTPQGLTMIETATDCSLVCVRMVDHLSDKRLALQLMPTVTGRCKHGDPAPAHAHHYPDPIGMEVGEQAEGGSRQRLVGDVTGGKRREVKGEHEIALGRSKKQFLSNTRETADFLSLVGDFPVLYLPRPLGHQQKVGGVLLRSDNHVGVRAVGGPAHEGGDEEIGLEEVSGTDEHLAADALGGGSVGGGEREAVLHQPLHAGGVAGGDEPPAGRGVDPSLQ